jgi:hypothetical protein
MSPVLVGRSRLHDERGGLGGLGGQVLESRPGSRAARAFLLDYASDLLLGY